MTDRLTMVLPQDARAAWPHVRDQIAEIARACGERWIAEDVFFQLGAGGAYLWTLDDFSGFLVIQIVVEPYGRELHCWICYNKSGEPPIAYWDQLLEIAREQNCVAITFENDRKGFQRAIPGLQVRYLYRAELS
jgi:hypothetical protein